MIVYICVLNCNDSIRLTWEGTGEGVGGCWTSISNSSSSGNLPGVTDLVSESSEFWNTSVTTHLVYTNRPTLKHCKRDQKKVHLWVYKIEHLVIWILTILLSTVSSAELLCECGRGDGDGDGGGNSSLLEFIWICLFLFILGGNAGGTSGGTGLVPLEVVMFTLSSEPLEVKNVVLESLLL